MKLLDIIALSKEELTGGGQLEMYTPDATVYRLARQGLEEIVAFFPLVKVVTVKGKASNYFDLPAEEAPETVVEVVALEANSEEFNFEAEQMFFATSGFMDFGTDLENWIRLKRNLRAYQVLTGEEFVWEQSPQNPHRIFVDDVPHRAVGFTVKFTTKLNLPDSAPENAEAPENIDLAEPQASYLNKWLVAKMKKVEGALLRRFKPSGQAVDHDGSDLVREGATELKDLEREMKERGHSLIGL